MDLSKFIQILLFHLHEEELNEDPAQQLRQAERDLLHRFMHSQTHKMEIRTLDTVQTCFIAVSGQRQQGKAVPSQDT